MFKNEVWKAAVNPLEFSRVIMRKSLLNVNVWTFLKSWINLNYVQDRVLFMLAEKMIIFLTNNNTILLLCILFSSVFCFAVSRSRDRPVLVRGPWRETNRALWEEAQPRGGSGQQGGQISAQDAAAAQQPPKQAETGERTGSRGQGLVPVTNPTTTTPHLTS